MGRRWNSAGNGDRNPAGRISRERWKVDGVGLRFCSDSRDGRKPTGGKFREDRRDEGSEMARRENSE